MAVNIQILSWCAVCQRYRRADIGQDPLRPERKTELLRPHRVRFMGPWCPLSGCDANPEQVDE